MESKLLSWVKIISENNKVFKINQYLSRNIDHSMSVISGIPLGEKNDLCDLYVEYEIQLLFYFKDEIKKLREENTKFIFIMDISGFPYIVCGIDPTDTKLQADGSNFVNDIRSLWNNYDKEKIITIIVNQNLHRTGLKYITFNL